jgi:hypothetical protein
MDVFPEPTLLISTRSEVFVGYLDFFRSSVISRVESLSENEIRSSRLTSGWTPIELLRHLTFVEMRWLEWGFEGRTVEDPWGDNRDGRWYVGADEALESVVDELRARGVRSRTIIRANSLDAVGQPGERWSGNDPATLERVLFHLLQEYARHVGHLDIVAELAGGSTGE